MKRTLPLFFFPFLLSFFNIQAQSVPNGNGIVFVKKGSTGDGSNWANAAGELSDAMWDAKTNPSVKQIWVAAGIYRPSYRYDKGYAGDTRLADSSCFRTFLLVKDVKIYGGFEGTETSITERHLAKNRVILDGQSDADHPENALHIVVAANDAGTALLDGFELRNGGEIPPVGRILAINNVNVNCPYGAGIMIVSSSPRIENVKISGCDTDYGAGISLIESNAVLVNVIVAGNKSNYQGGGIYTEGNTDPQFINCTIASNAAGQNGGGYYFRDNQNAPIRNTIIWKNSNNGGSGNGANIKNSLVQGAVPDPSNNNIGDVDPRFISEKDHTEAPTTEGDYRIENSTSPIIDKGDASFYSGSSHDAYGYRRIFHAGSNSRIDIGACEYPGTPVRSDANGIVYVKKGATGDGSSWANALAEPAYAVIACEKTPEIKEVWVAKGTYHPAFPLEPDFTKDQTVNTLNRFVFRKNIKLYGGFVGTEQNIDERSFKSYDNETVLSCDYNNDDIITYNTNKPEFSNQAENATVLMYISGAGITNLVLDGFTLTGTSWQVINSSALNPAGTIQLSNLTVKNNNGSLGAIRLSNTNSIVKNCKFIMNKSTSAGGGGLFFGGAGEHLIMNSLFEKNYAGAGGSAVFLENSICRIINCTMVGNTSASADNAIYTSGTGTDLSIHNSIIIPGYPASGLSRTLIFGDNDFVTTGSILQLDPVDYNTSITGTWSTNTTNLFSSGFIPGSASAAYEAGNTQAWLDAGGTLTDHDLAGKPRIARTSIDIGAFEYNKFSQLITTSGITKTYGDGAFAPTASANSGLPLQFVSADPGTAEIFQDAADGNATKIRIKNAGTVNITVSQPGDDEYEPAPDKIIELTINPKDLFLDAGNYSRPYGESNPAMTIQYNGFITGEGPADIIPPAIATAALPGSAPGDYPVALTGGSATNYTLKPTNGTLRVTGAVVNLQQQPEDISFCEGNSGSISVSANAPSPLVNLQYQWERSTDGNTWQVMNGATASNLHALNRTGFYRCIVTAPGTTITSDAAQFTLYTAAVPVIEITNKVCIDNTLLALKATPSGGVFSGPGIQNNVWNLEIPSTGQQTIHYTYTDAKGCTGATSKTVELQPCHSKSGGISIMSIVAFPNPTNGPVTLRLLVGVEDNWFINVSNTDGKSVQQKLLFLRKGWNTIQLNLTPLPSGMYNIALGRGGKWKQTVKLIKK